MTKAVIQNATAILALVGVLSAGIWGVELRYAKASDTKQQIDGVKKIYLRSEQRNLSKEKFDLESLSERRPLTERERNRLREVKEQIEELKQEIDKLGK